MKNIRLLIVLFLTSFLFAACTDTREELDIKNDGSGTLVLKTDIGKILAMAKSFGGDSDLTKNGMDKPFDTTMQMKDYVDTARDIPTEKKALLRYGSVHINMDVEKSIGKFDMHFPYTSFGQLQQLYASLGNSSDGLKGMFDGMGKSLPKGPDEQSNDKSMPQIASVYDIVLKDGLYSRKVNKARYDDFTQAMKLDELKQMGSMLGEMDYTLSITFPRKVKTVSNEKAILSPDKRTVTLKTDLMETFQHPVLLALDITY